MSSQKMHSVYIDEDCEDYDGYDKYDKYDDFNLSQTVRMNTSNKTKKNNITVYSQKHVRNCAKKYNK
jgi:hypothetical protein